jgi:hypothetical protein
LFGLTAFDGSTPNSLVKIDPITGATMVIGATGLSDIFEGDIAFNPLNGRLYGIQDLPLSVVGAIDLFEINPATGAATVIGSLSDVGDFSALAFNSAGVLFTINTHGSGNSVLSTVDPVTAALLTSVNMNVDLGSDAGMAFDPVGGKAYLADGGPALSGPAGTNTLRTLDTITGIATAVGSLGDSHALAGMTFVPEVPEPATCALLLAGLVLVGFVRLHHGRRIRVQSKCGK